MDFHVRSSLFLKIFLWFWATAIVTAIAFVLAFILGPQSVPALWYSTLTDTARYAGQTAIERVETSGSQAVSAYLGRQHDQTGLQSCLFDVRGQLVSGQQCGRIVGMFSQLTPSRNSYFDTRHGLARVALTLNGSRGARYIFVTELPAGPRAALGISGLRIGAQWGVAILVSGLVCLLLTRYITRPIFHLRSAAQKLATGDFGVRAPAKASRRKDEIGELVQDFNRMAARIESLVRQQRQLLSDISHELRSPLARLNVALDLSRERKGNDMIFDHMDRDLNCLDDMIDRLLTVPSSIAVWSLFQNSVSI
jgi:two-component system, OmpR family, sensor histidine kinase CpxA